MPSAPKVISRSLLSLSERDVIGEGLTPTDQMWLAAAKELSPDKSLAQIQDSSKFLVGSVALVGALLTGFGLIASDAVRRTPLGFSLAVIFAGSSLILGLFALVPRSADLKLTDLTDVEAWFGHQIRWRRRAAAASAVALGLAILIAGATALLSSTPTPDASTSLQVVGIGSSAKLQTVVHFKGLPQGSEASVRLEGLKADGSTSLLSLGLATPATDGSADLGADLPLPRGYTRFVLTATVTKDGRSIVSTSISLSP